MNNNTRPELLKQTDFVFPYLYKFPGQESREVILYVTREAKSLLYIRLFLTAASVVFVLGMIGWIVPMAARQFGFESATVMIVLAGVTLILGGLIWYYLVTTWRKTVGVLTNYRLVKIVQYGLFNHAAQTLPLDEIVDTSVSSKKLWERMLGVANFTARSAASSSGLATDDAQEGNIRINKKYFYWEHICFAEDFENYLHKILKELKTKSVEDLVNFRPFIGGLKGERRAEFMHQWPPYWS